MHKIKRQGDVCLEVVIDRVPPHGFGFHHRTAGIRAAAEASGKTPASLVFSLGGQDQSHDKDNGAGKTHTLFSFVASFVSSCLPAVKMANDKKFGVRRVNSLFPNR